jgi:AcrR family transcriptional regulator
MSSEKSHARRKPPAERRAELLDAAAKLAIDEGLERVTARRVADSLGVFPGLVSHYFGPADELVAAAFVSAAASERDQLYAIALAQPTALEQLRMLLREWLDPAQDAVSLLWLDAWQASRRRPALLKAVSEQMEIDSERLGAVIAGGVAEGSFRAADPKVAATQIMSLIDGISIQAAIRETDDYTPVREHVVAATENLLGLTSGSLAG